jgi:Subtilase family
MNKLLRIVIHNILMLSAGLLIFSINSCKTTLMTDDTSYNHIPNTDGKHYNHEDNFDSTQVIFWKKGKNKDEFTEFQKDFESKHNPAHKLACGNCNEDAIIYQGDDIPTYYTGQTASGGGSGSGGGGSKVTGDDTVYWCANYKINYTDSNQIKNDGLIYLPKPKKTTLTKTVAIFDTGIDTSGIPRDYFYTSNISSCLGNTGNNGWNFVNNTPDWADDNDGRHGTMVTRFVLNEVNAYGGETGVKILPVKTHDKNGEGDLFSVLCGISYAADRKADIVNASFGFYTQNVKGAISGSADSSSVLFLKEFVTYYLTRNNILLVAAAGNVTTQYSERDLNKISFYPASLSADLQNVIAVTTVDTTNSFVDPNQNYSDTIVSIGVNADTTERNACLFSNPRIAGSLIRGSSFATPIATGNLCAHYNFYQSLVSSGGFTRTALLNNLNAAGLIRRTNRGLGEYIAGSNAMLKKARP